MRREPDRMRRCFIDAVVDCRPKLIAGAIVDEIAPGIHLIYPLLIDEVRSRKPLWCADAHELKALCTPWPIVSPREAEDELAVWALWKKRSLLMKNDTEPARSNGRMQAISSTALPQSDDLAGAAP